VTRGHRHRSERLAALLKETLAETITTGLKDPRVGFVTVTAIAVAPDGAHATIHVSVMGTDEDKQRALEGLESARGFLRSRLAQTLELRVAPELQFVLDRSIEHARRIDDLLNQLKQDGTDS
jgi:ribosome-binding factor A